MRNCTDTLERTQLSLKVFLFLNILVVHGVHEGVVQVQYPDRLALDHTLGYLSAAARWFFVNPLNEGRLVLREVFGRSACGLRHCTAVF